MRWFSPKQTFSPSSTRSPSATRACAALTRFEMNVEKDRDFVMTVAIQGTGRFQISRVLIGFVDGSSLWCNGYQVVQGPGSVVVAPDQGYTGVTFRTWPPPEE